MGQVVGGLITDLRLTRVEREYDKGNRGEYNSCLSTEISECVRVN